MKSGEEEGLYMEPWQDKSKVEELLDKGLKQGEIADRLGCSDATLSRWIQTHGINTTPWKDRETMKRLHHEMRLNYTEMAERLGCCPDTVTNWMENHGLERKTTESYIMSGWSSGGYPSIMLSEYGKRRIFQIHRLIGIAEFGLSAVKDKHVHHRNHVVEDWRPENLALLTPGEHRSYHNNVRCGNRVGETVE